MLFPCMSVPQAIDSWFLETPLSLNAPFITVSLELAGTNVSSIHTMPESIVESCSFETASNTFSLQMEAVLGVTPRHSDMADIVQSLIIMARRSENLLPASFFEAKTVPVSLVNVLPQLRHIHLPRPWPLTDVAGFNKWRDQFERNVMKGEKGIKIIAPTPFKKKIEEAKLDPDTKAPLLDADGNAIMEEC